MSGNPLQIALRRWRTLLSAPRAWAGMGVVGLVLGLSGPFGTYADFALPARLAYWAAMVVLTFAVGYFFVLLGMLSSAGRVGWLALRVLLAGLLAGGPVTLSVLALNLAIYGGAPRIDPLLLLGYCTAIAVGVSTAMLIFAPTSKAVAPAQPGAPVQPAEIPPILGRLNPSVRGQLVSISVADHYVEVRTDRGKGLLLLRLSDAIRETAGVEGMQIHRSHWVAREAVVRMSRHQGRVLLELTDGTSLPVSRAYLPAVREAGWR